MSAATAAPAARSWRVASCSRVACVAPMPAETFVDVEAALAAAAAHVCELQPGVL